jgi:putative transposase
MARPSARGLRARSCDREVIAWTATTTGIAGEHLRDLMAKGRAPFGSVAQTPHTVEWLADKGSAHTALKMVAHAYAPGWCVAVESNGMAESFVKSFKWDYVFIRTRSDAISVLKQLAAWFDDYNEVRPHRELRMCPPTAVRP